MWTTGVLLVLTHCHMGLSENRENPIVPNGFADHYPVLKNGYFIGNINPTFSDKPIWGYKQTYN